jgi:alkylation response protein AidB-like acyl-CoA dehydrogenase
MYRAPLDDLLFQLRHVARLDDVARLDGFPDDVAELAAPILEEAARLAEAEIAPLNEIGDRVGARLEQGRVTLPEGYREAFAAFCDGGWKALPFPEEIGGQNLPWCLAFAVNEIWYAANLGLSNCPLLTQGAIEALWQHGSAEQQRRFLQPLTAGRWTGTMCLTEPQAGTDLGAVTTRAVPDGDGFRLFGTKIYITFGEHDLADNIVHLVLARLPDAPPGTRGLSLFVVPKLLVDAEGRIGARNDVHCLSLEHKLGSHVSPTCVLQFGETDGAIGELIGEPHGGMRCMWTMMNQARLSVGLQGLAIAERAYQEARAFAAERIQGRIDGRPVPIARHPDVRRMLRTMQTQIEAMRGLVLTAGAALDTSMRHRDDAARARARRRVELLTPVVKAWCTDLGVEIASLGIQVHGGMGYIEDCRAAQHLRDARITPIYEGTNGVQALDLAGRKLRMADGELARELFEELRRQLREMEQEGEMVPVAPLRAALANCEAATRWLQADHGRDAEAVAAGATPYLRMLAQTLGGFILARGARAASALGLDDAAGRRRRARFYVEQLLPPAAALLPAVTAGSAMLDDDE